MNPSGNIKDSELSLLLEPSVVKSKFNISEDELQLLRHFGEKYQDEVNVFIDDFYHWMQGLPEFPQFFNNSATVERVKSQQIKYWHEFFKGQITATYLKNRVHIGAVHAEIGLPIHSYCAAMNYSSEWWAGKIEQARSDEALSKGKDSSESVAIMLASAFNKLIQLDITIVTETYHQNTQKKLQATLNETQKIVHDVTSVAEAVVKGDYSGKLADDTSLSKAVNTMIESLNVSAVESKRDTWIKTGQAQLAEKLRGDLDMAQLCANAIEFLTKYLSAQVGVFYLVSGESKLVLMGSYAYQRRKHISNEFEKGEGLIGQAVLEKETIVIEELPENYLSIGSGLGEANAGSLLINPIMLEGSVKAIIEIGTFGKFKDEHLELLKVVNDTVAVSIESARNRQKMNELLEDSQKKSAELEKQSKELSEINKDLEDKAQKIKASEEELKSQSEELQATNEELEEKTQALEDQKRDIERKNTDLEKSKHMLQQKAEELQKSSKYKSEFLSNMSHELRTPLNSLLILAQSFMENDEENLSQDQVEKANVIYNSGKDLLNLINDILDLSKVEAGKLKLDIEEFSPADIANSLSAQLKPVAESKQIKFNVELASDLPEMMISDSMRIEQILKNLLSNALKFTENGGEVTLSLFRPDDNEVFISKELDNRDNIAFAVKDTGVGISKEDQVAIFEAFQQADGSINRKYGGTGLGLTISRQLAELLGGEIRLDSEVGQGSTFTLVIPVTAPKELVASAARQAANQVATKPVEAKTAAAVNKPKEEKVARDPLVLIIEDDANFLKILESQFKKKKLNFITAKSGQEGFEKAIDKNPTAIILDVGLPDISGLDLLEKFRVDSKTKHIPVHVVSAADVKEKSIQKGAIGFISKPVDKDSLVKLLSDASDVLQEPVKEVLVVEDDPVQSENIKKLIQTDNVNITEVKSGKEAEEVLITKRIHCIVLDLNLPDMSGTELLERISKNNSISQPTVIIYTARDVSEEEEKLISQYTPTIVLKSANAPQRLIDEVNMFLHDVDSQEAKSQVKTNTSHNSDLKGTKVLLVDDDMRNNIALGSYLRKHGLETVIADNGELAIQCLESEKDIDLVLMDIMMPVMDGYTAIKHIRQNQEHQDLPIIALTAKAMAEDKEKCLQAGASDYLTKPVDLEKLFQLMKVWLSA